jgi:hypothetical protein
MPYKDPEKRRANRKRYYLENKEKIQEVQKKWVTENREKHLGYQRTYNTKNREKKIAQIKTWRTKRMTDNPELVRETHRRYWKAQQEKITKSYMCGSHRLRISEISDEQYEAMRELLKVKRLIKELSK